MARYELAKWESGGWYAKDTKPLRVTTRESAAREVDRLNEIERKRDASDAMYKALILAAGNCVECSGTGYGDDDDDEGCFECKAYRAALDKAAPGIGWVVSDNAILIDANELSHKLSNDSDAALRLADSNDVRKGGA